jgi:hypothetical protein
MSTLKALRKVQEDMLLSAVNNDTELANRLVERTRCTKAELGVFFCGMTDRVKEAYISKVLRPILYKDQDAIKEHCSLLFYQDGTSPLTYIQPRLSALHCNRSEVCHPTFGVL